MHGISLNASDYFQTLYTYIGEIEEITTLMAFY